MGARRTQWLKMLKAHSSEESRQVIEAAIQADPTPGHICVTWILRQFRDEVIRIPEDAPKVRDLLTCWLQVKATGTFLGERDIHRHNYYGLRRLVDEALRRPSQRKQQRQIKRRGVETIHEEGRYRIVRVATLEAAAALARGTRWCTRCPGNAADYLEAGPCYIVFRDGVRYAQLHLPSGEMKNERDMDLVPDADLAAILERVFRPVTLEDTVGLSLVLGRLLLAQEEERDLLRMWSDGYDDEDFAGLPIEAATKYLTKLRTADPTCRARLVKLVREELTKGRLDLAWQMHAARILPMRTLWRAMRRAIRRCYATRDFGSVNRLLRQFQGSNVLDANVSSLEDKWIECLWRLLRLVPGTRRAVLSAPLANDIDERARKDFAGFYEELREIRSARQAAKPRVPAITKC